MKTGQPEAAVPLSLRPAGPDDEAFLFYLYASTRAAEMALVGWDPAQKESFLRMQFDAQQSHYQKAFPQADHDIILAKNKPIGRLYVDRSGQEIRLLDITIVPEKRNNGVGTAFIEKLKEEARQKGVPVRFYVWQLNQAAYRLYRRLGFLQAGEAGAYLLMEWWPDPHSD